MAVAATRTRETVSVVLPLEPESASRARRAVQACRESLDRASFLDLELLISELVAEALIARPRSPGATLGLQAELRDDRVNVEVVTDAEAYRLPPRLPEPGEPGWGLHLVRRLADRWGVRREVGMAGAWLEMRRAVERGECQVPRPKTPPA